MVNDNRSVSRRLGGLVLAAAIAALPGCAGSEPDELESVVSPLTITGPGFCGSMPSNSACGCHEQLFGALFGETDHACFIFTNSTRFYENLSLSPYTSFNDTISSLYVGPDAKARFCRDPGDSGGCLVAPAGYTNNNLPKFESAFNNTISSIRVDKATDNCMAPGTGQAAIFELANFGGDCVVLSPGDYPNPFWNPPAGSNPPSNGGGFGLNDNVISSVIVGPNAAIVLWTNANFSGSKVIHGSGAMVPNLGGFDNVTTSLSVIGQ